MRVLRPALIVVAAAALTVVLCPLGTAQAPRHPALVAYQPSGPQLQTDKIRAFVSLPDAVMPGQNVYVTVRDAKGTGGTPEVHGAKPGCQEVLVTFPGSGRYEVFIETELPSSVPVAGDCQGGTAGPHTFEVAVPAKGTAGAGAAKGAGAAARVGRGGGGGGRNLGSKPLIGAGDFKKLVERAKGVQPSGAGGGEEGFERELPYASASEQDEELGADETRKNRRNTLAFVAGGLLALVAFLQAQRIRAEVNRQPLTG